MWWMSRCAGDPSYLTTLNQTTHSFSWFQSNIVDVTLTCARRHGNSDPRISLDVYLEQANRCGSDAVRGLTLMAKKPSGSESENRTIRGIDARGEYGIPPCQPPRVFQDSTETSPGARTISGIIADVDV